MAQWRSARRDDDGVRFSRTFHLLLIALAAVIVVNDRPGERNPALIQARTMFNDAMAPALDLAARPLRGLRNMGPWWERQLELAEENRELERQVAELAAWRDLALSLRDRAQLYEQALNLDAPAARERISGWTVAEREGPFVRARLIGIGAEDGVQVNYPALNVYGLVGRVVDVGARSARILLLTDLNSRVAVMADRTNQRALLVGDNSEFPRLEYLGREPDLQVGDRIVTSGDDNEMPRGVPVGEAIQGRDGAWRVALYSRTQPVDLVWVWPYEPVPAPEAAPVTMETPAPAVDEAVTGEPQPAPAQDETLAEAAPTQGGADAPPPAAAEEG